VAAPQISGSSSQRTASGTTCTIDISGVANGSWIIVSAISSLNTMTITPPAGWTTLAQTVVSGTRANFMFAKIRSAGDGSSAVFTQSNTGATGYGVMWGTGADSVANWTLGAQWLRTNSAEASGSRYNNVAKSVTTTSSDNLVIAISHEATNAMIATNEISSVSPSGWTQQLYLTQVGVGDRIETVWYGTKTLSVAGASGDVTITYTSPQDSNGWAWQIAIPPMGTAPSGAPTVVGTPTTVTITTTTGFTINKPSGAVNDDYLIVALRGQSSGVTVEPTSPGFTRLGPAYVTSSSSRMNGFYGRPITNTATEPASYDFTFTATSGRLVATAFLVRGVDLTTPLAGYYDSYAGTVVSSTTRQVETYALASSPALALFMGGADFSASADHVPTSTPAGFSVVSTMVTTSSLAASRTYVWVGSQEASTNVAAGAITWGSPAGLAAEGIALRAAAAPASDPAGTGFVAADGAGDEVKIYHMTASGARTPTDVFPMLRGFKTVTQLLAKTGATWAHRGGSASYPEMSLYGYTQSVARGYGALEVSLARTSDGVWFGLHDQTTDRTSGGTYGNASSQTWAQIQAQQNTAGPGGPQPYMRWEQLIAAYGSTHIIIADPKYALGSYRTEFLDMVDRDLGPTRAIIKYSGPGSGATGLATAASARGYQTWGFFYATDASAAQGGNGNLQTWGSYWTTIGMEYNASQAIWDEAKALGKPVIGHIAPNQAAYNSAMSKGASAVQVSGVSVVAPVSWWTP